MRLSLDTKRAREGFADIDYADRLDSSAKEWLEVFLRATLNLESDAIALLEGAEPQGLQQALYRADYAQRQDITYVGERVALSDIWKQPDRHKCIHCYRTKCKCRPRKRHARYSQSDYLNK